MRSPSSSSSSKQTPAAARGGGAGGSDKKAGVCCSKAALKRGAWTPEEDEMLADYIRREGEGRWRTLPKKAGLLRCGKSCRLRWMNYLRPSVKRGHITPDEEDLILRLHRLLGNRWSLIAGRIPGRTDNEIKNYWNTHLSKKLISQGIDPKTHKPFNPNVPSTNNIINNPNGGISIGILTNGHDQTCADHHGDCLMKDFSRNCDDAIMSSNINEGDGDIHDGMISNCCPDDAFATFLNSLINDDIFDNNQQDQDQDQQHDDQHSSCLI